MKIRDKELKNWGFPKDSSNNKLVFSMCYIWSQQTLAKRASMKKNIVNPLTPRSN